jgi:Uma2 family endonuclease
MQRARKTRVWFTRGRLSRLSWFPMTSTAYRRRVTVDSDLPFERVPDDRHAARESGGHALVAPGRRHNLIVGNIVGELRGALRDVPAEVHPGGLRVRIPSSPRFVTPDVTVVCQTPRFDDQEEDALTNPSIVFEVISEGTEAQDRGDKFEAYATIASLAEYVLVSSTHARVERFVRHADASWTYRAFGLGEQVPLSTAACQLAVEEIYLKVFAKAY